MQTSTIRILLAGIIFGFFSACSSPTISNPDADEISSSSSSSVIASEAKQSSSSSSVIASEAKQSSSNEIASSSSTIRNDISSSSSVIASEAKQSSSSISLQSIYEAVVESGMYTTRDSVAAYLCKFDKLPSSYVNKNTGKNLYESETGNLFSKWNFNPWATIGVMIGGDIFNNYASNESNYHSTLPEGSYFEADVDYSGENRGTKRLVYQSDCVIYYTADHYENFTLLDFE